MHVTGGIVDWHVPRLERSAELEQKHEHEHEQDQKEEGGEGR